MEHLKESHVTSSVLQEERLPKNILHHQKEEEGENLRVRRKYV
jgi:hypothetical protein